MKTNTDKMDRYLQERLAGNDPVASAQMAGYSASNIKATASRLEQREDIRKALRAGKRAGGTLARIVTKQVPARGEPDDDDAAPPTLDPWKLRDHYDSPLALLLDVMNNKKAPGGVRMQCAKDAMPYCHARKEGGKKQETAEAGKKAAGAGKFQTMAPPTQLRRAA